MGLWAYVIDSDEAFVLDGAGNNVIVDIDEVSYSGDIVMSILPEGIVAPVTLTPVPDAVFSQEIKYNTIITGATYGKERRRNKWPNPKRGFVLQYKNISGTVADSITSFYNERGNYQSFNWTNPIDSTEYRVRFVEESIKREYIGDDRYNIQFNLTEML